MKNFKVTLIFEFEENGKEGQGEYSFTAMLEEKQRLTYKSTRAVISIGIIKAMADGFYNGKDKVNCHTIKSVEEVME